MHLAANFFNPQYSGQNLSDDLMTIIEILTKFVKNTPDINEMAVISDNAECWAKQKLWSTKII